MLTRFLRHLETASYASSVLSLLPFGALRSQIAKTCADVYSIEMSRKPWPSDLYQLGRVMGRIKPDVIHGWMYHGNLAATLGSLVCRALAPVIWSVHHSIADITDETPANRRLIQLSGRISSGTSAIVYCSRVAAEQHEAIGFDPRRTLVIPNGIDCNEFQIDASASARLRTELAIPTGRTIVGHVSRFHPMKDQANLVRALARLIGEGYDIQGVFVGEGHIDGTVRTLARELGIDQRITTIGPRADVSDYLAGFDLFALSSAWGESFSLATAEAMSCGVPAVVTGLGDCGQLVGKTGLVVPPRDTEALARGIASLVDLSQDERHSLGLSARRRVEQHFSIDNYVARHLELYQRVVEAQSSTARLA
ncbi:glycosyltransferase [Jiella sp. MQZ9-1]|uniref:Glycosyltransferase n=2 Tax=Jiella flava TaxID=2816857 RepID=A0A939JSJ8_9HYPH|nr:glycosyltransferase [Jiella flava]MCD2471452.1 glycosyltransferase [Jiella flava]